MGKAFLASLKNRVALNLIRFNGLEAFTKRSILDEKTYLKALDWVRRNGYALDEEEYLVGIKAVAVNVGNRRGLPLLIWVVGLAATMSAERIPRDRPGNHGLGRTTAVNCLRIVRTMMRQNRKEEFPPNDPKLLPMFLNNSDFKTSNDFSS